MVQAVQMFQTSDGQIFDNQDAASIHESGLQNKEAIERFLDKHFPKPEVVEGEKPKQNNSRGYARKAIALWLAEAA